MCIYDRKIIFSGNTAWGMYNSRGKLMRHFVEQGYAVSVLAPEDSMFSNKLREMGCYVIDVKIEPKGSNPYKDLMLIWHYYKIFKREKPNVSITYTIKPNIYAGIAARLAGIPFLPVTTGMGYVFLHDSLVCKIAKWLYKFAFAHAKRVWFLNKDDMQTFKEQRLIRDDQIELLHGEGIDTAHFSIVPLLSSNSCTFILVGRILKDKGVAEYVEAAKMIRKQYPDSRFLLLGALWEDNPAAISKGQLDEWNIEYLGITGRQDNRHYDSDEYKTQRTLAR